MAWQKSPPALIELFAAILPADPRVERRQMFGYPAAFASGRMFAGLFQDQMSIRLPEAERAAVEARHGPCPFAPMPGRPMRGYISVPPPLLADRAALERLLAASLAFVAAPPPKAKPKRK